MEILGPGFISVPVGGEAKTPGGGRVIATYEDPRVARRAIAQFGKVARYESEHVVVAENLGIRSKRLRIISDTEGEAEVSKANPIVAATHIGDGDGHDRLVVISLGMEPSSAAVLANQEKSRAQDEISEVAKEATIWGELNGNQIRNAMKDGREGRKVVFLFKDQNGHDQREVRTRVKGPVAMIPNIEYPLSQAA